MRYADDLLYKPYKTKRVEISRQTDKIEVVGIGRTGRKRVVHPPPNDYLPTRESKDTVPASKKIKRDTTEQRQRFTIGSRVTIIGHTFTLKHFPELINTEATIEAYQGLNNMVLLCVDGIQRVCKDVCLILAPALLTNGDDEASIIICDGCDTDFEIAPLYPNGFTIPAGDWFCPECTLKQAHIHNHRLVSSSGIIPIKCNNAKNTTMQPELGMEDVTNNIELLTAHIVCLNAQLHAAGNYNYIRLRFEAI